jgi:V/A-type H+-transporting ATPase subunit D
VAQNIIKVAPTKNTLLTLRKHVAFLEQGHSLLERKRDLLTRLVYERIGDYRKLRRATHAAVRKAYSWLAIAQLRIGGRLLQQASLGTEANLTVEILPRRALGVQYPAVNVRALPLKPVGLLGTDASFDATRSSLTDAARLLARLAESQAALARLIAEQRKAQKRVNALKYNIIPRYRNTIRFIESALQEEERNMLFQIKVLRARSADRDAAA